MLLSHLFPWALHSFGLKDSFDSLFFSLTPPLAGLLILQASQSFIDLLSIFSSSVLLSWEIIITSAQEIELVWKSRNSVVKYLFFLIRYGAIIQALISNALLMGDIKTKHNICRLYILSSGLSCLVLLWSVDILLIYRAFAFCGRDRRVLIGFGVLWMLNSGVTLVLATLFILKFNVSHSTTFYIAGVIGECNATSFPLLLHDVWISELVFQSCLFLLVLGRFIKLTATSWKNNAANISILYIVFIRDGIWAYFLLFGIFVASATQTQISGLSLIQWAFNFSAITGCRLVLNLRSLNTATGPYIAPKEYVITKGAGNGSGFLFDSTCEFDYSLSQSEDTVELENL